MSVDSYGPNDKQAHCAECAKFMPWDRSVQVEKSDGMPSPSPVLVEVGLCVRCETRKEQSNE
jgi:hypothetical protein